MSLDTQIHPVEDVCRYVLGAPNSETQDVALDKHGDRESPKDRVAGPLPKWP